jgi:hypothetical protein
MFRIFFVLFLSGLLFILGAIIVQLVELYRKKTQFSDRIQSIINDCLILINDNQNELKNILQNMKELYIKLENQYITEANKTNALNLLKEFEIEKALRMRKQELYDQIIGELNAIQKNHSLALEMQNKKQELDKLQRKKVTSQFDKELIKHWKKADQILQKLHKIQIARTITTLDSLATK